MTPPEDAPIVGGRKGGPIAECNEDGTLKPVDDPTTLFVLAWNDWSTDDDRQQVYRAAWEESRHSASALAFINAVATANHVAVPEHISDYLIRAGGHPAQER